MKKILAALAIIVFTLPVFSFELPAGKVINKEAVSRGIENYTKLINANPKTEDAYINRAFLYFLTGDIKSAISDYDTLISINPKNEEFYLNRGYLKHISNRQAEAIKDYDAALQIKPDYAFAYNNKGVAFAELGKVADSFSSYNAAIKINPNYADAYYNRGNLKTKIEKNEEALEDFNTAIKLNPQDSASFNNRGVVKRKLNYNVGALSDFSIAIKLNPDDITAFANRGRLKKRYFDSEGAEEDFKNAIAIAEDSPTLIKEVEVESKLVTDVPAQNSEQKPTLRESKVCTEGMQKIAYNVENTKVKTTNPEAIKAGVVKVNPKSNKTSELPTPLSANNTPNITTKPVENPKLAECYYIRALQKYILQNRESALKDFNTALQYNPNYAEAYYYRAAIKRDMKDAGFVDDYKKAVSLNPQLKAVNEADVLMILKI